MYFLFDNFYSEYAQVDCKSCWLHHLPKSEIDAALSLPLCHVTDAMANLSWHARCQISNHKLDAKVRLGFNHIWQALAYITTCRRLIVSRSEIHEISPDQTASYAVNHCGSELHVYLTDDFDPDYRVWRLDQKLWLYAMSQGEDWHAELQTDVLAEIVFQLGDVGFYDSLSNAGFRIPTPEYESHICQNFRQKFYCWRPEAILRFQPKVPPVVTAQMLTQYIRAHQGADWYRITSDLLQKLDLGEVQKHCGAMILGYFLNQGGICLPILQNLYDAGLVQPTRETFLRDEGWDLDLMSGCYKMEYVKIYQVEIVEWLLTIPDVELEWFHSSYILGWYDYDPDPEVSHLLHNRMPRDIQILALELIVKQSLTGEIKWISEHTPDLVPDLMLMLQRHMALLNYDCVVYLQKEWQMVIDADYILLAKYKDRGEIDVDVSTFSVETLFRLVLSRHELPARVFRLEAMAGVDFNLGITKTQLVPIISKTNNNILDLAPDLDDVTLFELVILTRCPDAESATDVVELMRNRGQEVNQARWRHYFMPGGNRAYACANSHSKCYTLNLLYRYYQDYTYRGLPYIWQQGWLDANVAQILAPHFEAEE